MYLLLTDKTNRAGTLMIIHTWNAFTKGQNTQVDIYFIFATQLKFGIDPLYQAWLFDTFSNCHNLHIGCNTSLFDMHWAMRLIKMHCIKSLNIKMKVSWIH